MVTYAIICILITVPKIQHVVGLAKWHNLQARLDLKQAAEKTFSPTEKIMINQLWDQEELRKQSSDKYPELIEVDMDLTRGQRKRYGVFGFYFQSTMNAVADPWPNGVIKYRFSNSESVKDKTVVVQAMESWKTRVPCISFKEDKTSPESSVLLIVERKLTFASVGYRSERKQHVLSIADVAQTKPVLLHLLGHVLGLPHAHSRPDRDRFLRWFRPNIELGDILFLNQKQDCPYDFASVMHYDQFAFTMNRNGEMSFEVPDISFTDDPGLRKLIQPDVEDTSYMLGYVLGVWTTPTLTDIVRVENGYGCRQTLTCLASGYPFEAIKMIPLPKQIQEYYSLFRSTDDVSRNQYSFNVNHAPAGLNFVLDMLFSTQSTIESDMACSRLMTVIQPAQRPTSELLAFWLLSGCTYLQIDIYDLRWDLHDVYCGAQFARMYRKVIFSSVNFRLYLRLHRLDHPAVKSQEDGMVLTIPYEDFICTGDATTEPPCQAVPDSKEGRTYHWSGHH